MASLLHTEPATSAFVDMLRTTARSIPLQVYDLRMPPGPPGK